MTRDSVQGGMCCTKVSLDSTLDGRRRPIVLFVMIQSIDKANDLVYLLNNSLL